MTKQQFKDDFARQYHLTYPKENNVEPFIDFKDAMNCFIIRGNLTIDGHQFIDDLLENWESINIE